MPKVYLHRIDGTEKDVIDMIKSMFNDVWIFELHPNNRDEVKEHFKVEINTELGHLVDKDPNFFFQWLKNDWDQFLSVRRYDNDGKELR